MFGKGRSLERPPITKGRLGPVRSKTGIPQTTVTTGRLGYGTSGIGGAYQPREVVGECLRTQPTWSPAATQTILAWATRPY